MHVNSACLCIFCIFWYILRVVDFVGVKSRIFHNKSNKLLFYISFPERFRTILMYWYYDFATICKKKSRLVKKIIITIKRKIKKINLTFKDIYCPINWIFFFFFARNSSAYFEKVSAYNKCIFPELLCIYLTGFQCINLRAPVISNLITRNYNIWL